MTERKNSFQLLEALRVVMRGLGERVADVLNFKTRATPLDAVYGAVVDAVREKSEYAYLMNIFTDDTGQLFAVIADDGRLFRADVFPTSDGVSVGDWVEVIQEFVPTGRSRFMVVRQADGRYRAFMISSTTVLNRVGEIDSRQLHDNLNKRAEESGRYPYVDFFHKGPNTRIGEVDFLGRDDNVAIASFLFDEGKFADAMRRSIQREPEFWGASISYYPSAPPEVLRVADSVDVPVYVDGEYEAITLLPEVTAASWFTGLRSIKENNRMNSKLEEALKKLAEGDEDTLKEFVELVDGTNRQITDRGLITRDAGADAEGEAPEAEAEAPAAEAEGETGAEAGTEAEAPVAEATESAVVVSVTEEDLDAFAASPLFVQAVSNAVAAALAPVAEQIAALVTGLETANAAVRSLQEVRERDVENLDARLRSVEAEDTEKQKLWAADLGRKQKRELQVSYRPRANTEERAGDGSASLDAIAEGTLANIK